MKQSASEYPPYATAWTDRYGKFYVPTRNRYGRFAGYRRANVHGEIIVRARVSKKVRVPFRRGLRAMLTPGAAS